MELYLQCPYTLKAWEGTALLLPFGITLVSSAPPQGDTLYPCNVLAKSFVSSLARKVHNLKPHKQIFCNSDCLHKKVKCLRHLRIKSRCVQIRRQAPLDPHLDRFIPRGNRFSIKCVKSVILAKSFVHLSFLFWTRTARSSSVSKTPYKQAGLIPCAYVLHNAWAVVWRPLLQDWLPVECAYYCRSLANYLIPLQWTSCRVRSIDRISTTQ